MKIQLLAGWMLVAAACLPLAGCDLGGEGGEETRTQRGLRLHPDNPRYLEFRGRPTVLITSGEHYGAVLNADFDYVRYLDELARHGFNQTRVFSGSYVEAGDSAVGSPSALRLGYDNTLAPRPGRFVSPWARADALRPDGGRKFDLARWNPVYFERLKRFMREAGRRGIVVEMVLFSALYSDESWQASPFNARNNVNRVGAIDPGRLYTLDNGVLEFQDALVRKLVTELRPFDNLYYEVINEGWMEPTPASDEWQDHIIETIEDAESGYPQRHLIARNYRHRGEPVTDPHPSVSIFNLHYQRDPTRYLHLPGVLSLDETGLQGTDDTPYRTDGWFFMLSGGGIYSNLDFSFTPTSEDGGFVVPDVGAGGGGPSLRRSLAVLKRFLERFDLPQMFPSHEIVTSAPTGTTARVLADPGRSYAIYLSGAGSGPLVVELAPGQYRAEWVDTEDGTVQMAQSLDHPGLAATLTPPPYQEDIALAIEAEPDPGSEGQ
jgi:hypothetical protein